LGWLDDIVGQELANSFVRVLSYYAQKYSASHTSNQCSRFQHFAREQYGAKRSTLLSISAEHLINYRSTLDRQHEWYLGVLRGFLKSWVELGYAGIDADVLDLLEGWRLRGNIKGRAVQILCPLEGPLSDFEFEALHQKLIDAFDMKSIAIEDFVLAKIFMATGRRPAQLADLKIRDFIFISSETGLKEFLLNIPRRKVRGSEWRKQFKAYALSTDNGMLISSLIKENKIRFCMLLKVSEPPDYFEDLPLFPKWTQMEKQFETGGAKWLRAYINTPEAHHITIDLRKRLDDVVLGLKIPSERTGEHLRVFPTRLRRTLATRAAREGFGELVIAELLDHTDTQNARVYTENVPEHVDAINKAVAKQLAPLAQAFAGVLVDKESDAVRGDDLSSRVRCENGNVGTCGHHGFCGALAPIACYTCRNFQPWVDGPHEEILDSLIADRDRILEMTQDKTMAAINDRTILAVTQVIQKCEVRKQEVRRELNHG
jgi:integrase